MFTLQKPRKKASSRMQIDLKGVRDGILMLNKTEYRAVYEVSSVNFELKSEAEQDVLIDTYESFLNSLPCAVQILVRIRELDMSRYLSDLQKKREDEPQKVYKQQLQNYCEFVQELISDNAILSRHFYVVLPFSSKDDDFDAAKLQLSNTGEMVSKGFARLGIRTRQLDSLEALDLFHSFYNPAHAKRKPITDQVAELLSSQYVKAER